MLWGKRRRDGTFGAVERLPMERPMLQSFDASKSLTAFEQDSTLVVVIEMSHSKWLVLFPALSASRSRSSMPMRMGC